MKKLIALVLALCLLCMAGAFAEETAAYTVNMDAIPQGYTMNQTNVGSDLVLLFMPEANENLPIYFGSVAFSELFDGYTLNIAELTEEEKAQVVEMFSADYNDPTFDFTRKTAHGTDLIILSENGAETDTTEVVTIWQGYFITIGVYSVEEVTDEMVETAIQILSDLWVVAQ